MTLLMYPLEKMGELLRSLSLSGAVGNLFAIVIYIGICLIPMYGYLYLRRKHRLLKIDHFLIVISLALFITLYLMINPFYFAGFAAGGTLILGGTFYSLLCAYIIFRILHLFESANTKRLLRGMGGLLCALILVFTAAVCVELFVTLPENIKALNSPEALFGTLSFAELFPGGNSNLRIGSLILVLQSLVNALPYVLDAYISYLGIWTLKAIQKGAYSDASVHLVNKLAKVSMNTLKLTVACSVGFQVIQLLCFRYLTTLNISLNVEVMLPILSIALVLAVMILAKYVQENQKLKRDNELFI